MGHWGGGFGGQKDWIGGGFAECVDMGYSPPVRRTRSVRGDDVYNTLGRAFVHG